MGKAKRNDYTSGYEQTDQDNAPAISFAAAFGEPDTPGVTTALTPVEWLSKSPVALVIDVELTELEWHDLLRGIEKSERRHQWYYGDAMVYGVKRKYGETEAQIQTIVEITGKDDKTLDDYYKTALLFEISERSEILKFEQHRVLARRFSDDTPEHRAERLKWLHIAETQDLSGRKLNAEIVKAQLPAATSPDESAGVENIDWLDGVTVERVDISDDYPALSDESIDVTDVVHEKRIVSFRKKAQQNRLAEIDLNDIIAEQDYLAALRKKVAAAKVEATRQARTRGK